MSQTDWAYLNRLPVAIRKKTTPLFIEEFKMLLPDEQEKKLYRTKSEIEELVRSDSSLFYYIRDGYHYSTMNGFRLQNWTGARYTYKTMLEHASIEYANTVTTVWFDDKWQKLKDVAYEL